MSEPTKGPTKGDTTPAPDSAPGVHADASSSPPHTDDDGRVLSRLVGGLRDGASEITRAVWERKPPGQESIERLIDIFLKIMNRREVLERIVRSDFMRNVRDMQSEITEAVGIASQSDVQDLRAQLTEVIERLDKLQNTLDEIVVEVEEGGDT